MIKDETAQTKSVEICERTAYRNPPVVERVVVVNADMSEEQFASGMESWESIVKQEYPNEEPIIKWSLNMEERDGVPLFETMQPELQITPRHARKPKLEGFDWSIRSPRGRFVMNMHSEHGTRRRYVHLRNECARWLPHWFEHFRITTPTEVSLLYVNHLRLDLTPGLYEPGGALLLEDTLTIFSAVPGVHEAIIPPLDCRMNVRLIGPPVAQMQIRLRDLKSRSQAPALGLYLQTVAKVPADARPDGILELLDWSHERILERFDVLFTEDAKKSFDPE